MLEICCRLENFIAIDLQREEYNFQIQIFT